jgi:hypothetical protein
MPQQTNPLFSGPRDRVQTIEEALEIFATRITSPTVAEQARKIIQERNKPALSIELLIHKDNATEKACTVKIKTNIQERLGQENFHGVV